MIIWRLFVVMLGCFVHQSSFAESPNIVIIFTDDQGYADVGCYGAQGCQTPNLDRMAAEGIRFTDFYVPQAVCSASRAGLLTGCYPNRIGILGALGPGSKHGIHQNELLLSEVVKQKGYATALFGKWHLGHRAPFLPTHHGFDNYYGLPYSNDMWPKHPERPNAFPDLPLLEGEKIVEYNPDQSQLTTNYTRRAVKFIEQHQHEPFFVYLAHNMPHVPLFVSEQHQGQTEQGLYGDVIQEIDWSVGQILGTLKRLELDEKTLVIFTSDNGPWLSYGNHAGSAKPLREGKGTSFEGGVRVPCIMRWPGKIPAGAICQQPAMTLDLLPTIAKLLEVPLPPDRVIDGKDIWPLMSAQPKAKSLHEVLYFYWRDSLQAVRSGPWKLHLPHSYRSLDGPAGKDGIPGKYTQRKTPLALYNLEQDPQESNNLLEQHPNVVQRLMQFVEEAREDLGDRAVERKGKNLRPRGQL